MISFLMHNLNEFRAMNGKRPPTQLRLRKLTSKFPECTLDIEIAFSPCSMHVGRIFNKVSFHRRTCDLGEVNGGQAEACHRYAAMFIKVIFRANHIS